MFNAEPFFYYKAFDRQSSSVFESVFECLGLSEGSADELKAAATTATTARTLHVSPHCSPRQGTPEKGPLYRDRRRAQRQEGYRTLLFRALERAAPVPRGPPCHAATHPPPDQRAPRHGRPAHRGSGARRATPTRRNSRCNTRSSSQPTSRSR